VRFMFGHCGRSVTICGMSFLSAGDIWKVAEWVSGQKVGSKAARKKAAEAWLDSVYTDLEELSRLWLELATFKYDEAKADRASELVGQLFKLRAPQYVVSTRLEEFYRATSSVLGADNPFQLQFLENLGKLLVQRRALCEMVDRVESGSSDLSHDEELASAMKSGTIELQRQCAVLQAAITSFKSARDN
jgi:hypothetical protein